MDTSDPDRKKTIGAKILLMDDNRLLAEHTSNLLQYFGYEVVVAYDGEKAISLYEQERRAGRPFDAVILDINVPNGMGGGEAFSRLHRIDPSIKAIVSSGDYTHPLMTDFRKLGFKGALPKPYSASEVRAALREIADNSVPV